MNPKLLGARNPELFCGYVTYKDLQNIKVMTVTGKQPGSRLYSSHKTQPYTNLSDSKEDTCDLAFHSMLATVTQHEMHKHPKLLTYFSRVRNCYKSYLQNWAKIKK